MRKIFLYIFVILFVKLSFAQSIVNQNISPVFVSNPYFSATIGQVSANSYNTFYGYITEGFFQTYATEINDEQISDSLNNDFFIKVFPNPFQNFTNVYVANENLKNVNIRIFDFQGRNIFVLNKTFENKTTNISIPLNFSEFSKGLYILQINVNNSYSKDYKILLQ